MKIIVVGSGPAGISAAKGLLDRGCKITLLDVGNLLEPHKQRLLDQVQQKNDLSNTDSLRYSANAKKKIKLPYGSSFIYDDITNYFSWNTYNGYFQPSFARGGLSNVWGGAIEKYSADELLEWPIACRDLSPYYLKIITWLGKYYKEDTTSVLSRQACFLKNKWSENRLELQKKGFAFQTTALAVDFNNCHQCGFCQYGCPYGLIYHGSIHLELLKADANFTYIDNMVVENFSESDRRVELIVRNRNAKKTQSIFADRLFIACGSGLSSLLYLRSLNKPGKKLFLKDSQHFMLPCLISTKFKDTPTKSLHTLCQLKAILNKKQISNYPIYLQFYTYMDLYVHEIKNKLKWLSPFFKPLIKEYAERLVAIQGYLNSKESNHLVITYEASGQFDIRGNASAFVKPVLSNVMNYFKQHSSYLYLKPLLFLFSQSPVGQSNHVGGSLAMTDTPNEDQVDIWGKPLHFTRIHFVDGSILPTIPAGPLTLTIMANAYRIGNEAPL